MKRIKKLTVILSCATTVLSCAASLPMAYGMEEEQDPHSPARIRPAEDQPENAPAPKRRKLDIVDKNKEREYESREFTYERLPLLLLDLSEQMPLHKGKLTFEDEVCYQIVGSQKGELAKGNDIIDLSYNIKHRCATELRSIGWQHYPENLISREVLAVIATKGSEARDTGQKRDGRIKPFIKESTIVKLNSSPSIKELKENKFNINVTNNYIDADNEKHVVKIILPDEPLKMMHSKFEHNKEDGYSIQNINCFYIDKDKYQFPVEGLQNYVIDKKYQHQSTITLTNHYKEHFSTKETKVFIDTSKALDQENIRNRDTLIDHYIEKIDHVKKESRCFWKAVEYVISGTSIFYSQDQLPHDDVINLPINNNTDDI